MAMIHISNQFIKLLRLFRYNYVFVKDFFHDLFDDKISHYASSLSWSTIFSLFPLLALFLVVFSSLPLFEEVRANIVSLISASLLPHNSEIVLEYTQTFLQSTHKLGLLGGVYVLIAIVLFFKNYDYIVNDIFHLPSRTFFHALWFYALFLFTIPILFGASFYTIAFIKEYLDKDVGNLGYYLLPFGLTWLMFYLAYQLSANTKIEAKAALLSSFSASLVWFASKSLFIFYVLHNKTYETIYGNISILLFMFLWIYISWAVFLHGLKFCYLLNEHIDIDGVDGSNKLNEQAN